MYFCLIQFKSKFYFYLNDINQKNFSILKMADRILVFTLICDHAVYKYAMLQLGWFVCPN